ncbi:pyridoxamine 5'-phosphate oxidase family protein [Muriicola sp. SD30]|uniref:pyridoxamine 5'-phosphate oxidase family protein n=1 Tax=Muriicola sp. SD30 TaxID=3240936 RepID=UPI00350F3E1A
MGRQFKSISSAQREFIASQAVFFVSTAPRDGHINLSPKGIDTFRILSENKVVWLNLTGSGNETAAHVMESNRMTIMFCAFQGAPKILRLYGKASVFHPGDSQFDKMKELFPDIPGSRQIFEMDVELVQSSCGMGVPLMECKGQREELLDWAKDLGEQGLQEYKKKKNTFSLDGRPTGLPDHN